MRILSALWPSTLATRLFLIVTFVEMLVNVVIMSILLAKGQLVSTFFDSTRATERSTLPVYLGLFTIAHVFQLVLAAEAIFNRNLIQIFGLVLFNGAFLVYSVILEGEVRTTFEAAEDVDDVSVKVLAAIIPCIIGLTQLAYFALSYQLWQEFGWQIFKHLGADRRIRRYFMMYQIFVCILKFDWFFFLAFSLQFILVVLNNDDIERYITIAATPLTLLVLVLGYFAIKRENRAMTLAFMLFMCCGAAYFLFKLIRIYVGSQVEAYRLVRKSLTVFSSLSMLAILFTLVVTLLCMRNFDKGLRFHLRKPKSARNAEKPGFDDASSYNDGPHYKLSSAAGSRLSID